MSEFTATLHYHPPHELMERERSPFAARGDKEGDGTFERVQGWRRAAGGDRPRSETIAEPRMF